MLYDPQYFRRFAATAPRLTIVSLAEMCVAWRQSAEDDERGAE